MNLRAEGGLVAGRRSPGTRHGFRSYAAALVAPYANRPGLVALTIGFAITATAALLEALNPHNCWLLFEDVSAGAAPTFAAIAVFLAAARGEPQHRS